MIRETTFPREWLSLAVGDLYTATQGVQISKSNQVFTPQNGCIRYLYISDFKSNKAPKFVEDKYPHKVVHIDDLIMANTGTPGAIFKGVSGVLSNNLFKIGFNTEFLSREFTYFFFLSPTFLNHLNENHKQTAQPHIGHKVFSATPYLLPPVAEQKVIANKLDSLLAQVETTKARLDRVPDILKRFRQSVLASAVSGRLTEEWRASPKAAGASIPNDLIERERLSTWLDEQRKVAVRKGVEFEQDKIARKYKKSTDGYVDEFDLTAIESAPSGWVKTNIDSISIAVTGKTPKTTDESNWNGEIPFISPSQIRPEGSIGVPERFVSQEAASKTPILPEGAILIVCIGTIGKVGLLDKESAFNQQINALIPTGAIKKEFLYIWAQTLHSWLNKTSSAVVNAAIINKSRLCSAPCPLPPMQEQEEIVHRVEELFAFADTVEQKAQAASERVNKLTQSILAKAFRGELTEDWRAANPDLISGENSAEALLEKIKAEREALTPKKRARRTKA